DIVQNPFLDAGLAHQPEPALRQVAEAAVKETARAAAGPEGEVMLLDEPHAQAAHGRIAGHARAYNPAPDDQNVQGLLRDRRETLRALVHAAIGWRFASRNC